MKTVSAGLAAHMQQRTTTLCRLIEVMCRDGETIYLCDNNRSVSYNGHEYRPDIGFTISAILMSSTILQSQNVEFDVIMAEAGISEADLRARRYEGATATVMMINYKSVADGVMILFNGLFGRIIITNRGRAKIELMARGSARGRQITVEAYSATCRNAYGDENCTVNVEAGKVAFAVDVATNRQTFEASELIQSPADFWALGRVRWLTGDNEGLYSSVMQSTSAGVIQLVGMTPNAIQVGDTGEILRGCRKTLSRCDEDSNTLNFRGEPYVPETAIYVPPKTGTLGSLKGNA